jgi:hypothetical protein
MTNEMIIRAVAGFLVVVGAVLAWFISSYWLALPAFVGINLFQSAFTHFCPLEMLLKTNRK